MDLGGQLRNARQEDIADLQDTQQAGRRLVVRKVVVRIRSGHKWELGTLHILGSPCHILPVGVLHKLNKATF